MFIITFSVGTFLIGPTQAYEWESMSLIIDHQKLKFIGENFLEMQDKRSIKIFQTKEKNMRYVYYAYCTGIIVIDALILSKVIEFGTTPFFVY